MRRFSIGLLVMILLLSMAVGASAATSASNIGSFATVSADGSCQVSLNVTLHLEQGVTQIYFPLPSNASHVTVNGSRAWVSHANGTRQVNLSKLTNGMAGDFTVTIHYSLSNVVKRTEAGLLELQLPLLSGFSYPVSSMTFSVSLPGAVESAPSFSSGYHQSEIEKNMTYTMEGATISGTIHQELNDHETLTMLLPVTDAMFPQTTIEIQDTDFVYTAIGICAGLAFLYWILFLRTLPFLRQYCPEPPEGTTAGELGCILNTQGLDLTMTVFSWARMGYILIQIDRHDRVLLHKRMEMGNERSETERFYFRKLFGKKQLVETTSYHYAQLCRMAAKRPAGLAELMRPHSGNPRIFRALASGIGLFGGVALGSALGGGAALHGLVVFLVTVFGAVSAWLIQQWAFCLLLRGKQKLWIALGCCAIWLILGVITQSFTMCLWIVSGLLLAGLLTAFGGRRTSWGRQACGQLLGLRHYLRTIPVGELQRISRSNPEYFHTMAPYALASGTDKAFAKRFGPGKLPGCPWLTTGMDAHMNASDWAELMRWTADAMDARSKQLTTEKLLRLLDGFRK